VHAKTGDKSLPQQALLTKLRELSFDALPRMYVPGESCFAFRLQRTSTGVVQQGLSPRYTSIVLLALATEDAAAARTVLTGHQLFDVCRRVSQRVVAADNLGDVALALWSANANGFDDLSALRDRLRAIESASTTVPAVELSWVVSAAVSDSVLSKSDFVHRAADRLLSGYNAKTGVFSHVIGNSGSGLRGHVSCFADFVYPMQALSQYHGKFGRPAARDAAVACADRACKAQGPDGQWWWHFDWRTGAVVEGYPVYSVHQHGMGPMALFDLATAGGPLHSSAIGKSLEWLERSPEISGSLIDEESRLIWRKVARREPAKLARKLQAAATLVSPSVRIPGVDWVLPPRAIDFECRPYELGWLLYAWPPERVARWNA